MEPTTSNAKPTPVPTLTPTPATTTTTTNGAVALSKLAARVRREFPSVTASNVPVVTRRILELSNQMWDSEAQPRIMDNAVHIVHEVVAQVINDATSTLAGAAAAVVPALLQCASPAVIQKPKPVVGVFRITDVGFAARQIVRAFTPASDKPADCTYVMNAVAALVATAERLDATGAQKRAFVLNVLQDVCRTEGAEWCSPDALAVGCAFVDEAADAFKNRFNLEQCAIEATGVLLSLATRTRCFGLCSR